MAKISIGNSEPTFHFIGVAVKDGRPFPVVEENVRVTDGPESLEELPFLVFNHRTKEEINLAECDDWEDDGDVIALLFTLTVFTAASFFMRNNAHLGVTACTFELYGEKPVAGGASIHPQTMTFDGKTGTMYFMFMGANPLQDQTPDNRLMLDCFFPEEMFGNANAPTVH